MRQKPQRGHSGISTDFLVVTHFHSFREIFDTLNWFVKVWVLAVKRVRTSRMFLLSSECLWSWSVLESSVFPLLHLPQGWKLNVSKMSVFLFPSSYLFIYFLPQDVLLFSFPPHYFISLRYMRSVCKQVFWWMTASQRGPSLWPLSIRLCVM